mmetsp:Transcript_28694/g.43250  ORF Transcript_28694/g.43250 Transcript_28694/m.43250 type:complete len:123 (+) Transcript_28694:25-393(+)
MGSYHTGVSKTNICPCQSLPVLYCVPGLTLLLLPGPASSSLSHRTAGVQTPPSAQAAFRDAEAYENAHTRPHALMVRPYAKPNALPAALCITEPIAAFMPVRAATDCMPAVICEVASFLHFK